jgi:23S rRNA pseudouridine1911/1915/1917 synthase
VNQEPEHERVVGSEAEGERLDRWLAREFPAYSRSEIQRWIRHGRVQVGDLAVKASQAAVPGQRVRITPPPPPPPRLTPEDIPLNVLFEDEHLLVLLKPSGLQVHPGAGAPRPTLAHALLHRYPGWDPPGSPGRPGIVHRLDRDTSGLLVVARTPLAYQELVRQIQAHEVTRRYVALVWGQCEQDSGRSEAPLGRDPRDRRKMAVRSRGRSASTQWRVLRRFDSLTLLDLVLGTGRTHQIRVHMAHLGHPVLGDPVYGGTRQAIERLEAGQRPEMLELLRRLNRQALHAYHLTFRHPVEAALCRFEAPVPADMDGVLERLSSGEAPA